MTVSDYLLDCKIAKLTIQEMEFLSIGACLDHCEEYAVRMNPELEGPKEATQEDIQALKGR